MKTKKTLLRMLVLSLIFIFSSCSEDGLLMDDLNSEVSDKGGKNVTTSSEEETAGNCLSFPVIWSDGETKVLRGTLGDVPVLDGTWWYVWGEDPYDPQQPLYSAGPYANDATPTPPDEPDLYKAFIQKDEGNVWQASNWIPEGTTVVDDIDWGDNLESIDWSIRSQIRTEVVLYKDVAPVTQYAMRHCYSWGEDEVHGLQTDSLNNPILGPGDVATVFTPNARLTIQKLFVNDLNSLYIYDSQGVIVGQHLSWTNGKGWAEAEDYEGDDLVDEDDPLFNMAVHEASDGPGFYNAEVNVKGKVIFGYTWNAKTLNHGEGYYRVTFSFDEGSDIDLRTEFDGTTKILLAEEVVDDDHATTSSKDSGEADRGGEAIIDVGNNLTYMDINIIAKTTGGGGGNGGGGNGGGGSGGGSGSGGGGNH